MVTILVGRRAEYNNYIIDDMRTKYIKQYNIKLSSMKDFKKWEGTVVRPILGDKYLVEITEDYWIRFPQDSLRYLENFLEHPYIDIVWIPGDNKINSDTTLIKLIDLNKTSRDDFTRQINIDLPMLDSEEVKYLLKRLNYRWDMYVIYRDLLIDAKVSDVGGINNIVKETVIKSAGEIYSNVLFKRRFALNNYYKLQNKYSVRWVKDYFSRETERIIDAKIKLANREITYQHIRNSKKLSTHFYVISKIPLAHLQIFRFLLDQPLAIEIWMKESPVTIYNEIIENSLKRGKEYKC